MKIAIMQPAFCPPASYFRLFAASDLFVVLDNVQFNRRWYTHRQPMTNRSGNKEWLTLPIKKADRDTTMIKDLEWADDYQDKWLSALDHFTSTEHFSIPPHMTPLMFLCAGMFRACEILGIPVTTSNVILSSAADIPADLRGQDRIIALCKYFKATEYINSTGGKALYEPEEFARHGIKLTFLPDYKGSYDSVIERLGSSTSPEEIRQEIYDNI